VFENKSVFNWTFCQLLSDCTKLHLDNSISQPNHLAHKIGRSPAPPSQCQNFIAKNYSHLSTIRGIWQCSFLFYVYG